MKCYIYGGRIRRTKKDVESIYESHNVRFMQSLIHGIMSLEDYLQIMNVEEVADFLR